jgi:hypothetical protein
MSGNECAEKFPARIIPDGGGALQIDQTFAVRATG